MPINNLIDIFNDDEFGILTPEPIKESNSKTANQRLIDSFLEINHFIDVKKRMPNLESEDIDEYKLGSRLQSIINDQSKIDLLRAYDTHIILPSKVHMQKLNYDSMLNIDNEDLSIFKLQNVVKTRVETDFTAVRKPCKDFGKFEELFKICHKKLQSGELKFEKFSDKHLYQDGGYFLVNGIIAFLEKVDSRKKENSSKKIDGRTRIIFENGTESSMKLRSFGKALFINGKSIVDNNQQSIFGNKLRGYIYVLKSLSKNPEISSIQNLYKIGYSTTSVEERIKNALKDYTYLNAEVHIVSTGQIYDVDPQVFENIIHRVFAEARLNIEIDDGNGNKVKPQEWFIVPLPVIEQVIDLITSENIVQYNYDINLEKLILKK